MQTSVARVGGATAIAIGLVYLLIGVKSFWTPYATDIEEMMRLLAEVPIHHYFKELSFVLIALFFIPVMTAMGEVLGQVSAGAMRWATMIGYIGCAGTIMSRLRVLSLAPLRARVFLQGDETIQAAIQYNWVGNSLDPDGWLQYGAVGIWLLVVSLVALREGQHFPRLWSYLGLVGAVGHFAIVAGRFGFTDLETLAATLGAFLIAPVWSIWTGSRLLALSKGGGRGATLGSDPYQQVG